MAVTGNSTHLTANDAKIIKQQEECFDLREEGKSIREIARLTHLSKGTVQNRLDDEWIRRIGPRSDRLRNQQLAQIDQAYQRLQAEEDTIEVGEKPETVVKIVTSKVTLWARQARLCGLDAPAQVQMTTETTVQVPEHLKAAVEAAEERAREHALTREAAIRANGQ